MTTLVEEMGLHAEGFDDGEIAEIEAAIPDALHLWATIQQEIPHAEKIVAAEWPRIKRLIPVVRIVLDRLYFNRQAGQI